MPESDPLLLNLNLFILVYVLEIFHAFSRVSKEVKVRLGEGETGKHEQQKSLVGQKMGMSYLVTSLNSVATEALSYSAIIVGSVSVT